MLIRYQLCVDVEPGGRFDPVVLAVHMADALDKAWEMGDLSRLDDAMIINQISVYVSDTQPE